MKVLPPILRDRLVTARKRCTELGIRHPLELAATANCELTLVQHIAEFGVWGESASEFPEFAALPKHHRRAVAEFAAVVCDIEKYCSKPRSFEGRLTVSEKQRGVRAKRTEKQAKAKSAKRANRAESRKGKSTKDRDAIVAFMVSRGYAGNVYRGNGKALVLDAMRDFNCGETKVKSAIRYGQEQGILPRGRKQRRVGKI